MSRHHDMGGRLGAGPIPEKDDAIVFHADWHAKALALNLACGALGQWNIDSSRHSRERLSPQDYNQFSYYEKWMAGLTTMLVERGVVTPSELQNPESSTPSPLAAKALVAASVSSSMHAVAPYSRTTGPKPRFMVGGRVITAPHAPSKRHTRLPEYAMGKTGTVILAHGNHVLPDSNAHFNGEAPEPLYTVEFTAAELWQTKHDDTVTLDLWQSYLEPAS